jgi:hypothetical protein
MENYQHILWTEGLGYSQTSGIEPQTDGAQPSRPDFSTSPTLHKMMIFLQPMGIN